MPQVVYDFEANPDELVDGSEQVVTALARAETQAEKTTSATKKLDDAQDKAGKTTKAAATSTLSLNDATEKLSAGLNVVSPKAGGLVKIFGDLAKGGSVLKTIIGGAGAAGGITAGLLALEGAALLAGYAVIELGHAAADAHKRLSDANKVIDASATEAIGNYTSGIGRLSTAWDELLLSMGESPAALIGEWSAGMAVLLGHAKTLTDQLNQLVDVMNLVGGRMGGPKLADIVPPPQHASGPPVFGAPIGPTGGDPTLRVKTQLEEDAAGIKFVDPKKLQTEAEAVYLWLADKRAENLQDELDSAQTAADEQLARWEEELALWEEHQEAKKEAAKVAAEEIAAAWTDLGVTLTTLLLAETTARLEAAKNDVQATRARIKETEGLEADLLGVKLKSLEDERKAAKEAAQDAYQLSQKAAIASVLSSGAAAYAAMLLTFAPLGPGAPFAAAGVVAPAIAGQLAVVANNEPPAHDGTMGADEFVVGGRTVRQGERGVVLNQRAVENGAVDRVVAENRGQGAREVQPLVLADAGRVIGAAVAMEAKRPGSEVSKVFGTATNGVIDPYKVT